MLMMAGIHLSTQQENSSAQITSQLTKFSISFFQVSDINPLITKNIYIFNYRIFPLKSLAMKLGPSENVLISPFSMATVLAMAHVGAKGNTAIQIKNALQLTNFPSEQIYATIGNLVRSIKV